MKPVQSSFFNLQSAGVRGNKIGRSVLSVDYVVIIDVSCKFYHVCWYLKKYNKKYKEYKAFQQETHIK